MTPLRQRVLLTGTSSNRGLSQLTWALPSQEAADTLAPCGGLGTSGWLTADSDEGKKKKTQKNLSFCPGSVLKFLNARCQQKNTNFKRIIGNVDSGDSDFINALKY